MAKAMTILKRATVATCKIVTQICKDLSAQITQFPLMAVARNQTIGHEDQEIYVRDRE